MKRTKQNYETLQGKSLHKNKRKVYTHVEKKSLKSRFASRFRLSEDKGSHVTRHLSHLASQANLL